MDENLPGGSSSSLSLFGKIKNYLTGVPLYVWAFIAVGLVTSLLITTYYVAPELFSKITSKITREQEEQKAENIPEPTKPPPAPLATGKQTYMISGSAPGAPKITEATVDPIDPAKGKDQTWKLEVIDVGNGPVKEVTVTIFTDNGKNLHPLKLVEGTDTKGVWQGSWKIEDSYDYTYIAVLRAKNQAGKIHKVDLVLR